MRAFVVTLERRRDRRARLESVLPAELEPEFTTDWGGSFDGAALDLDDLGPFRTHPGWQMPVATGHRYWDRPLTAGEVGCALSHLACWERALADAPGEPAAFFEDDVAFVDSFGPRLSDLLDRLDRLDGMDEQWGIVYLGRSGHGRDGAQVADGILQAGFSYGSFGYVLSAVGLRQVVEADLGAGVIPVDEFLTAMFLDHPRPDIRFLYPKRIRGYALSDPLVVHVPDGSSDSEFGG